MSTITFNDFCNTITDLKENLNNNNIKVIPLKPKQKRPRDKGWSKKEYTITDLEKHHGNFGIMPGYNHADGCSLAIIDIDGYTMPNVSESEKEYYKNATKEYLYNCLKDLPDAMIVRTQSGGYHFYLWNETVSDSFHYVSNHLYFPDDFYISELRGESLKHSIEIFTKGGTKQCLLPGCSVLNEATDELNSYSIINGVNSLANIGTVHDISASIVKVLTENHNFQYKPDNTIIGKNNDKTDKDNVKNINPLKTLTKDEINLVVDNIIPVLQILDGTKHTASLYLGGFFADNITSSSCNKICNNIINRIGNIFNDTTAFKHTILQNYTTPRKDLGGLPKLCRIIKEVDSTFNIEKFRYNLYRICKKNYSHSILVKEYNNNKKKYLDLNYDENTISTHTWNRTEKKLEDGSVETIQYWTDNYTLLNMLPTDIYETYNILDRNESPDLCLRFYRKGMPSHQVIRGNDVRVIERQLENRPGIVLKPYESKGVINEVITEFIKLDEIHIVEEIPVEGVFCNPLTGGIARADSDGRVDINCPSVDSLNQAVGIWEDLECVYPGDESKLAHILRWGLLSPFSYILKTQYTWLPMLFLYGASGTSKTTLAEISLSPYTRITDSISIGGASFNTEYRIGEKLSKQGIGTIINEPSSSITNDVLIDLLKRCVESPISREKDVSGVHTRIPCYSNMCFTSNSFIPTNDAFVRRSDYLEFTKNERLSSDDISLFNRTFRHQNWNNTRFTGLRPIGDFMVYYVRENMDVLGLSHQELVFSMINALFREVGGKPFDWLFRVPELMDVANSDTELVNEFRRMVLRDYNSFTRNSTEIYKRASMGESVSMDENFEVTHETPGVEFAQLLRAVIQANNIDYLHVYRVRDVEYVIVNTSVKNALKDFCGVQVTCKGLADYMGYEYTTIKYKGNSIKGFRMVFAEFINFLNGGVKK